MREKMENNLMYVRAEPSIDLNKNTEWVTYPGVWTIYIFIVFFSWLLVLSLLGCSPGMAWTIVHLSHFFGLIGSEVCVFVELESISSVMGRYEQVKPLMGRLCALSGAEMGYARESKSTAMLQFFLARKKKPVVQEHCVLVGIVTYIFFHWKKGTPFADDQGIYNGLTWWEQIENGKQLTRNRKFLTVVPVVLYLIASHTTDYENPMLVLNTIAVFVLVVAKFPHMHRVRIFGINGEH
ncbi:hypothetical protein Cgig2_026912 [Carnegiea gigantea]|uniref:ORM1-like protein 2 n=1 Tax=Carnegiea gigantea TaxID=171969 RepID=A0A9Q1KX24_9CARY|nr:hypothetical protein Cgig2_026912 [Carnegiea gigantea]